MDRSLVVSIQDEVRYNVLGEFLVGRISRAEASKALGITERAVTKASSYGGAVPTRAIGSRRRHFDNAFVYPIIREQEKLFRVPLLTR